MLRTRVCDVLGIEFPVIQAGMGPFTGAELAAAVSNAGGLGSIGAAQRSAEDLGRQLTLMRELTSRPFAVNHLVPILNEEAFALTLEAKPPVVSFALGDPGDLVQRAHDAGSRVIQQVHTVRQARQAAERGVDAIIAQGSEAGGFGGQVEVDLGGLVNMLLKLHYQMVRGGRTAAGMERTLANLRHLAEGRVLSAGYPRHDRQPVMPD